MIDQNYLFLIIIVAVAVVGVVIWLSITMDDFLGQLRYINSEIKRTEGNEREYYLKKRKRLYKSLIPFYYTFHRHKKKKKK